MVYISQNQSFLKNEEERKKTKQNQTKQKEKKFITLNKHEFYDET